MRIGHLPFVGRGLLDPNKHFNCKTQHLLKKICINCQEAEKAGCSTKGEKLGASTVRPARAVTLPVEAHSMRVRQAGQPW